jgi:N-acetylmuramoyl-L-alanine amidase
MNIYIDVGHGKTGSDTGTSGMVGTKKYNENEQVLEVAKILKAECEKLGHTVTLSRSANVNITSPIKKADGTYYSQSDSNLIASADKCKKGDYDCMLALHLNSASNKNARGAQLFYKTATNVVDDSKVLANCVGDVLSPLVGINTITTRLNSSGQDFYGCLRLHDKPGVLVEIVFMSNEDDLQNFLKQKTAIGKGLANALDAYSRTKNGLQEYKVTTTPKIVVESTVRVNDINYFCRVYDSKYVELTVLKDINVTTNSKSGATYWASVLDNGNNRIYYHAVNPSKELTKFSFEQIVKLENGGSYTRSNARSYNGAVTSDCIQAWYIERGTSTVVIGNPSMTIGGYVDENTYNMLTK